MFRRSGKLKNKKNDKKLFPIDVNKILRKMSKQRVCLPDLMKKKNF